MADEKIIFSMSRINKFVDGGKKQILKNINLSFFYGAKIGILGLNGSGKSTVLRIVSGEDTNFQGDLQFDGSYKIGYLHQEPQLDEEKTVKQTVEEGLGDLYLLLKEYEEVNNKFAEPMSDDEMNKLIERQGELTDELDRLNAWEVENRVETAMEALRCPDPEKTISVLSGGERRRVALARLILGDPDILLLDEPTNHLDAESVHWLEQYLQQFKGTVIAVTHDRYFLDNVAGWILELDQGKGIPWKGNYSSWLEQKAERLEQEEKSESKRRKTLQRELEWVRMSPKARQSKSKARLSAYDKLAGDEGREREKKLELYIPPGPRLGDSVIEISKISKAYGDQLLFDNLDLSIPRTAIVGIIGANGVGKSTLFRIITGEEKADNGNVEIGETVDLSYVDQKHEDLTPDKTILEAVAEGNEFVKLGDRELNARAYLSRFNFAGPDQKKKIGVLSGGERNRVHLAMTLKEGGNVLLLDEPTNDLDINTLRALEDALESFAGTVMLISHDRWFMDRLATHIIAFEGDSEVVFFEGNYSDYETAKKARLGDVAPRRPRFKNVINRA
jgi:ATP-binding cassette ChvD family protein